jgi:hypothetical protein
VVNSLAFPVHVRLGGVDADVAPGQRRQVTVPVGRHVVVTTGSKGQTLETGELFVEAGPHLLAWNVLGAAPIYERTIIYGSPGSSPPGDDPSPHFQCGQRAIRFGSVDFPFSEPAQSIQMPEGQSYARRTHVGLANTDLGVCATVLARAADRTAAVALAGDLSKLGDSTATAVAVGLWHRLGRPEDALTLARQAAAAPGASIDDHRRYQDIARELGQAAAILEEYRTRAEASPDSADAAYLYARAMPSSAKDTQSASLVQRFPQHVPTLRLRLYHCVRRQHLEEAVGHLEALRRLAPQEWATHLEEHAEVLVSLRRADEAKALLEGAFGAAPPPARYRVAALHHWLTGAPDALTDVLVRRLMPDAADALRFRIRFWDAPADVALRPALPDAEHPFHRLALHAHFDPKAALTDALTVAADDLSSLDPEVLLLLLGEALRTPEPRARERMEAAVRLTDLSLPALAAYLERAEWSDAVEQLDLPLQGALHLSRSRRSEVPAPERERLRALAARCDPAGGFVTRALAAWPAT